MTILFLVGLYFLLAGRVDALNININSYPNEIVRGTYYPVNVTISDGEPNSNYYVKVDGGILSDNHSFEIYDTSDNSWHNSYYWTNSMPIFSLDGNGNITGNIMIRISSSGNIGEYLLTAKIKAVNSGLTANSDTKTINVIDPAPTNTPIPTLTNTPTSAPPTLNTNPPPPVASINSIPSSKNKNEEFVVNVLAENLKTNTEYYIKVYGGINDDIYSIEVKNNEWINSGNGSWSSMPKFTSDNSGKISNNVTIRSNNNKDAGIYKIVAKLAQVSDTNEQVWSGQYLITINSIVSATSTPIITSYNTATSTKTVTKILTPTVTKILTPTVTVIEPTDSGMVMGTSDVFVRDLTLSTPTKKKEKLFNLPPFENIFPILLIGGGGVLLLVPLIISKRK